MSWHIVHWDEEKVRQSLKRGRYDDVSVTGWGRLDDMVALSHELGIYKEFEGLESELKGEGYIPSWFMNMALLFRSYVGDESINSMQKGLFRNKGILRMLGVNAIEMQEGFDRARNNGENKPCHVDSLRYHVQGISGEDYYDSFRRIGGRVVEEGLIKKGGMWILDATKIEVEGEYSGMGVIEEVIETLDNQGRHHRRVEVHKGFKWVTLCYLFPGSKWLFVMSYRLLGLKEHEITVSDELIEEILGSYGKGFIGELYIDRGFLDGERIYRWHKEHGIEVTVPLKSNMDMLKDMQGLSKLRDDESKVTAERKVEKDSRGKHLEDVKVIGFSGLTSLDSYPGELNGLLVEEYRGKKIPLKKQWGFLTTKPLRYREEVLGAYDGYDDRSLIENRAYRESKQGYKINRFIGKDESSIAGHIFFETLAYNMVGVYRQEGSEKLIDLGIRRLRREVFGGEPELIVVFEDSFAIFELLEFLELLGRSPTHALDHVRLKFL